MKKLVFTLIGGLVLVGCLFLLGVSRTTAASPSHIDGLVGHWKFDEGGGSVALDSSGHSHHGEIHGATYINTDLPPVPGNVSALNFGGLDEVVILDSPDLSFGPGQAFSIALWFKLTQPRDVYHIIGKRSGCGPMNYQLARDGGLYHFNWPRVDAGVDIPLNQYMHGAVTFDGLGTLRMYLNGAEVVSATSYALTDNPASNVEIASSGGCTEHQNFPGVIDDVRIYNRALTADEVKRLASLVLEVRIDIKPGSDPNSINLNSAGVIPVAILSSDTFDATTVDPITVSLAGAKVKMVGKSNRYLCHTEDVNGDSRLDMVCQVETAQFMIEPGETVAVLEAATLAGQAIRGEDSIRIVPD